MVATAQVVEKTHAVPGPTKETLTPAGRRRLQAAQAKIDRAEREWAETVKELKIAAVARELGITPQSLQQRVKRRLQK